MDESLQSDRLYAVSDLCSEVILSAGVCPLILSLSKKLSSGLLNSARTLTTQLTRNAGEDEGDREYSLLMRLQTSLATLEMCGENSPQTRYKHETQLYHSSAHAQRTRNPTAEILAQTCSLHLYSQ